MLTCSSFYRHREGRVAGYSYKLSGYTAGMTRFALSATLSSTGAQVSHFLPLLDGLKGRYT